MDDFDFKIEDLHLDLRPRRKKKIVNDSPTKICLFSWNTNSKASPDNLKSAFTVKDADVYAIGLQEVGSFDWVAAFDKIFKPLDLVRIKMRRVQGIVSIVYIRHRLLKSICNIESEITKTGLAGMWGNKGGVSIRFNILGINVCIVNSHLAAHQEKVVDRLEDITSIIENQKFRDKNVNNILDHDYVFWMGDLNFRIDDMTYEQVLQYINKQEYDALLAKDQLKTVMEDGLVFDGFTECAITFAPTYKFDVGTNSYDTSVKKRIPAYCDRILYHHHKTSYNATDELSVTGLEYRSHPDFLISDHKPITSLVQLRALTHPPDNPVVFHKSNKTVTSKKDFMIKCSFKHDFKPVSGDWIGLYTSDFMHFEQYATYKWVHIPPAGLANSVAVSFPPAAVKKLGKPCSFYACYMSKPHSFCGISESFVYVD